MTPAGMTRSNEFSRLNPKPEMMIGRKLETGPLAIIRRNDILNASQNLTSYSDSHSCSSLKCLFRTPELFSLIRATAMYRSRSSKPFARIGSGGKKKRMTNAHRTVIPPAKRYLTYVSVPIERDSMGVSYMYCQLFKLPPLICPRP